MTNHAYYCLVFQHNMRCSAQLQRHVAGYSAEGVVTNHKDTNALRKIGVAVNIITAQSGKITGNYLCYIYAC